MNRFSADVGSNDDMLPQTLFDFSVIFFMVIGAVFTTLITLPFVFVMMPPLLYYFVVVRRIFVTSTRELKRLEGVARSPIFAMMNESLSGIATIRANDATDYFTKKFETVHDSHTRAFFSFIASSVRHHISTSLRCFYAVPLFINIFPRSLFPLFLFCSTTSAMGGVSNGYACVYADELRMVC